MIIIIIVIIMIIKNIGISSPPFLSPEGAKDPLSASGSILYTVGCKS